jgi:hypothetical protein
MNIINFTRLFYGVQFYLYYQDGQHLEWVTIIESSLSMRQGDLLGGHLFVLAHYRTSLKTIVRAFSYIFPSLTNNIDIVGLMNEIIRAFY